MIAGTSAKYNWTHVGGIAEIFAQHGICSVESYIRTVAESVDLQGDVKGSFHPNYKGHQAVANVLWPYLRTRFSEGEP